jgi:hypothetical protein
LSRGWTTSEFLSVAVFATELDTCEEIVWEGVKRMKFQRIQHLHRDLEDCEEEGNSGWIDCMIPRNRVTMMSDIDVTISGKLQHYCPVLFNSLTLLEKAELDNSPLLNSLFSQVKDPCGGREGGSYSCTLPSLSLPINDLSKSGGSDGLDPHSQVIKGFYQ